MICGRLSDRYGRRRTIFLSQRCSFFHDRLYGFTECRNYDYFPIPPWPSSWGASVAVPTFLAEMSPANQRGRIVTQNELMIVTGQLFAFVFNAIIGNLLGEPICMANYATDCCSSSDHFILWHVESPESPRWLVTSGKRDEALQVLQKIRSKVDAERELSEIENAYEKEKEP